MAQQAIAAVKVAPGKTELRELPLPDVPADAGLLKVEAAGVCGSDVPQYGRGERGPLIQGHENVGIIAKVGAAAAARWGVQEGDRVAIEEYLPCLHCEWCHAGEYRHCFATDSTNNQAALRYGQTPLTQPPALWGGFAQYLYLPPNAVLHAVPHGPPLEQLALALPLGNGVQWACIEAGARPGRSVLIMGPGQQGLACAVAACAAGADQVLVSGLSRDAFRLKVAKRLGVDAVIDIGAEDLRERVAQLTGGRGVDAVVDCTSGHSPTVMNDALDVLKRKAGIVVLQGVPSIPDFPLEKLTRKYGTLKSARGHSYAAVELGLRHIASRRFPLELMTTDSFGLDGVDRAIRSTGGEVSTASIHITVNPWRS
ncbi:MAG: zinc-dependent alcohol dehydrogenase [Chloroflexota bacterium]